jgi:hypothetical protein
VSIVNVLNQILNDEVVLPAIQRDFVWDEERTEKLLDSVMRGYPISIILLWETYADIQYRRFQRDFRQGSPYLYEDNPERKRLRLVLDGQQRLQSLYVALYGTRDGKHLYFDLLSGKDSDDVAEDRYLFKFMVADPAKQPDQKGEMGNGVDGESRSCYRSVADLFTHSALAKMDLADHLATELGLTQDDKARLSLNLSTLESAFSRDENTLKVSTIDEDLPPGSPYRKSEADVLEIFVRVNRQGTPLTRSDLIFSMLKLNWKESAEALPEFVRTINTGNAFELDTDFVIRCLFAVCDLGTKLDLDLLRKRTNVQKLRSNFGECCSAIQSAVDFVQADCSCQSSSVLGGTSTLVPFVYYLFRTKNHEIPDSQISNAKKALYLLGLARPFRRWGESRLGAFIRADLQPLGVMSDHRFPLERVVKWVRYWEGIDGWEKLLQANHLLTLHLIQGLTGAKVQYERNAPQIDHIFPRSELRKKHVDEGLINHFANFWILARGKNQNKSNRHPADYFRDVSDGVLKQALIPREMLDYRRYTTFLRVRRDKMIERIKNRLEMADDDFLQ